MSTMSTEKLQWYQIPPEYWNKIIAQFDQHCVFCGINFIGEYATSVRGPWEHWDCVYDAYMRITSQMYKKFRGTRDDLIYVIQHLLPGEHIRVEFNREEKTTEGRYFWETRVEP